MTVNASVAFELILPEVPVTVTVADPAAVAVLAANVNTPVELMLVVTPDGRPVIAMPTGPENPFTGVSERAAVPVPPCVTLSEAGFRASVNPEFALTVIAIA